MKPSEIDVYPLRYPARVLKALPEDEAMFFLMFGQMHNDINCLLRLVIQNRRNGDADEANQLAHSIAAHFSIRMLAARLYEGGRLIKTRFHKVLADLGSKVSPKVRQRHGELLAYFSGENLCKAIRLNLASHFDQDCIKQALRDMDDDEGLVDIHSEMDGNSTFFSGEAAIIMALTRLSGEVEAPAGLLKAMSEVAEVARKFNEVTGAYLTAFTREHIEGDRAKVTRLQTKAKAAPFRAFTAPAFLLDDDDIPRKRHRTPLFDGVSRKALPPR